MARHSTRLLVASLVFWHAVPAHALYDDEAGALTFDGSFRSTNVLVTYPVPQRFGAVQPGGDINRADGLSYSSFRLTAGGAPAPWFSYDLHVQQDAWFGQLPAGSTGLATGVGPTTRYRLVSGSHAWVGDDNAEARLLVDRALVKYHLPSFDLTLGRQAVTFGKARFWNPLDVFLPFDARQFDREYKPGVDAVRVDVPVGEMSGLTMVAAPGRVDGTRVYARSWYGSAVLGRVYTNLADFDFAAQGGKVYGGYQGGAGLAGALGPVEVRAEGAYLFSIDEPDEPTPVPDHLLAVVGVGRLFDSSLNLQSEYLYNGAGDDGDLETALSRVAAGRALQMSEHLVAAMVGYDLLPLLTGSVATIVSVSDGSGLVQPGLEYSVSEESDLLAGAMLAWGRRPRVAPTAGLDLQSEFGSYPDFFYAQYRVYF